jgi:hypothetical protein
MWPFRRKKPFSSSSDRPDENIRQVLSILSPEEASALGELPGEAIAGIMEGEGFSVDRFRPNQAFVEFMHHVIRVAGPADPGLQAAAQEQGDGWVYIIDLRTPEGPQGRVPLEDIIGGFEVRSGKIVIGSYYAFEEHRLLTENGLVQLPPSLREAFVRELTRSQARRKSEDIT